MSNSRSRWPADSYGAMPDFHPEFGLLCPSPRRRRGMRLALVAVLATMTIGATMGFAATHRTDGEGLPAISERMDEQPTGPLAPSTSSVPRYMPAAVESSPFTRARDACKAGAGGDMAALFLNPSCGTRKVHGKHGAQAGNRVATFILGRTVTLK